MTERDCINCSHAHVSGKYIRATLEDPEEYPEAECNYSGPGDIDKYFELLEKYHTARGYKNVGDLDAEYCPFYEDREN